MASTSTEMQQSDQQKMISEAVHFTVGRICEEVGAQLSMSFSKEVMATIADIMNSQMQTYSLDLASFARHARRTNISTSDVMLLARRNQKLSEHLQTKADSLEASSSANKEKKKKSPKKKEDNNDICHDEDKRPVHVIDIDSD